MNIRSVLICTCTSAQNFLWYLFEISWDFLHLLRLQIFSVIRLTWRGHFCDPLACSKILTFVQVLIGEFKYLQFISVRSQDQHSHPALLLHRVRYIYSGILNYRNGYLCFNISFLLLLRNRYNTGLLHDWLSLFIYVTAFQFNDDEAEA